MGGNRGWMHARAMSGNAARGPGGLGKAKKGAPLRKVVRVIVPQDSIFVQAVVEYECGHEGRNWGGQRGRCVKCKETAS